MKILSPDLWKGRANYVDIQVLEVSSRKLGVRNDLDLSITNLGDLNDVAKVSDTAVNFDLVL